MTFNRADFLDVALLLIRHSPHEGCERSSISRAYSAAFHSARDYCVSAGMAIPRNNAHVKIRRCLENQRQALFADDLRTLRDLRKYADYDVQLPLADLPQSTAGALSMAESILDRRVKLIP